MVYMESFTPHAKKVLDLKSGLGVTMASVTRHKAEIKVVVNWEIIMMKEEKLTKGWEKLFPVNDGA